MHRSVFTLFTLLLLLTSCSPSTDEDSLITFYEEDSEADDLNDDASLAECTSYSDFEDLILCQHNAIRAYGTDPEPETALEPLTWNTDLEDVARGHAEACVYEHNDARSDSVSGGYVGENIAAATWDAGAIYVVNMWAAEVEYYDYDTNSCAEGEQCGHYTQIVWSSTTEVGCAVNYCNTLENTDWSTGAYFYVCNYSPGGNYTGQQPY